MQANDKFINTNSEFYELSLMESAALYMKIRIFIKEMSKILLQRKWDAINYNRIFIINSEFSHGKKLQK